MAWWSNGVLKKNHLCDIQSVPSLQYSSAPIVAKQQMGGLYSDLYLAEIEAN
jgi:hypothetical protein